MQSIDPDAGWDVSALLSLWERGLTQADSDRGDALLRALDDDPSPTRTLGERTFRLLNLHARLFGRHIDLLSHCPGCGADAQFNTDCIALAAQMPPPAKKEPYCIAVQGLEVTFRLPESADVAAASREPSEDGFARRLLERCVLSCTRAGDAVPSSEWTGSMLNCLAARIEVLDPGASVSFALRCPRCEAQWRAPLDCGQILWQKVQTAAERLLLEIDVLARAYGWTEPEVLSLSAVRRAAYVQMVTT
jgi:hypothetical protein